MGKVNKLGQYKGIEVTVAKKNATEEEIKQNLEAFIAQNPVFEDKEGTVEKGDFVTFDFEGFKDGVAFEGGKADNYQLEIGSGQFIPGFEDQMIGMANEETKELNVTFPENYGSEDLAGADVVFTVTTHKIENKKEAELNDAFVAGLNIPDATTVEELRALMSADIQAQYDQQYRTEVENAIFDQLISECEVEADDENVQKALDMQLQHINMQLAQQGMQLEQYLQMTGATKEAFMEQLRPQAAMQAQFELIIDAIIAAENLATTDEEANEQLEMIANSNHVTKEQVLEQIALDQLKNDMNRMKASQLVITSATING